MPLHTHEILHDELQGFDIYRYTDIEFTFSGNQDRRLTLRLVFCKSDEGGYGELFGDNQATLEVSVISFYNVDTDDLPDVDMFDRPANAPVLTHLERSYLYSTLVDIILRIAETEAIQVLTFQAYTPQLNNVYDRLVRRYATSKNLRVHVEGACYVIRTEY